MEISMKKVLGLVCLMVIAVTITFSQLPKSGLVGYYPFSGNANDASGYGHNGLISGGVTGTTDRFGRENHAFNFNGSDGSITADSIGVNLTPDSCNMVSFWMQWNGIGDNIPFSFGFYNVMFFGGYFGFNTGNADMMRADGSGLANRWVHIVAKYINGNPNTSNCALYIDGIKKTLSGSCTGGQTATRRIHIGICDSSAWSYLYYFNGMIDDIRIYNRALSDSEITLLYHEGWSSNLIHVNDKWNMISLPLITPSPVNDSLFPTAVSNAFKFTSGSGYIAKDTLENGTGYWLKFPSSQFISMSGTPIYVDTIPVVHGWNLIGSLSGNVLTSKITTEPTGILASEFYGYNSGYQVSTVLQPGKGYWIKSNQNGLIILSSDDHPPTIPANPSPVDGAFGQLLDIALTWSACSDPDRDPVTYDVYFGTDNPPTEKISSDQTDTSLVRSNLLTATKYYWKVVAKDNHGNYTEGPVWNFTIMGASCPGTPSVDYEGKIYNTVQIGNQCWLKKNLDVGTMIQGIDSSKNNGIIEKYCYNNDINNCNTYGALYQWNEAMQYSTAPGTRGICPFGWHVPTIVEFQTLSTTVGGDGNALKEIGQGTGGGAGINTSGFTALLTGYRWYTGGFTSLSYTLGYWSSSALALALYLHNNDGVINIYTTHSEAGFSVRCVKD
jgi:uncharacterized protein (TIGR02145 family)